MSDAELVQVRYRIEHLAHEGGSIPLRVATLVYDLIEQLSAGHELHDKIEELVVFKNGLQVDDVGVTDALHDFDFASHRLSCARAIDDLDGVLVAGDFVRAQLDGGESTTPQLLA